jgi:hypothetical protein
MGNDIKNSIKLLLQNGATITCAYKSTPESWIGDAIIRTSGSLFIVEGVFKRFLSKDMDEAINYFYLKVFCKENLCYRENKIHQTWRDEDSE